MSLNSLIPNTGCNVAINVATYVATKFGIILKLF
jgi:hypothetical protein